MKYSHIIYKPEQLGSVIGQYVLCGKPNCRCTKGNKHLAYYHFYREFNQETGKWKLIKRYVPKDKVDYLKKEILECKRELITLKLSESSDYEFVNEVFNRLSDDKSKFATELPVIMKDVRKMFGRYMDTKFKTTDPFGFNPIL